MRNSTNTQNCSKCFHPKANHKENHFCTADLTCMCENFVEPISNFVNEINRSLELHKSIEIRVKIILTRIPNLRNAGEKSFAKAYKKLVYGFGPKKGVEYTHAIWKMMPHDDSINRARRKTIQHNPELGKNNHKAVTMAGATQEGILEWLSA